MEIKEGGSDFKGQLTSLDNFFITDTSQYGNQI